jgi:hypothetical protein
VTVVTALLLSGASWTAGLQSSSPSRVWFAPLPPMPTRPGREYIGSGDFMSLFSRKARWKQAARRIQVFKLYGEWVDGASFLQLRSVIRDLKRRRIALALELGPLQATADCGQGVEGFGGPSSGVSTVSRIKVAGGTLAYIALDEPFFFGSLYDGANACHWTAERIAQQVAEYIRAVRTVFPHIVVGDIEPLAGRGDPGAYTRWMDTYAHVTGAELPFFDLDVDFNRFDWVQETAQLESAAQARGMRFGLIYIGAGATDLEWSRSAEDRIAKYELTSGLRPDDVIFQSWLDHPDRVLPETKPGTFTWLIDRYFRPRPTIRLELEAGTATATLSDDRGHVMSGKEIDLTATPLVGSGIQETYEIVGTVPSNARTAVVGFRVNTECGCSAASDFTLYDVRYFESGGENRVPNSQFAQGLQGWGVWGDGQVRVETTSRGSALHVIAAPGQIAATNSTEFRVGPRQPFKVTFDARVTPESAGSGYFDVVFLRDTEVLRSSTNIAAAPVQLGPMRTDANGSVHASFHGDDHLFPAYAATTIGLP